MCVRRNRSCCLTGRAGAGGGLCVYRVEGAAAVSQEPGRHTAAGPGGARLLDAGHHHGHLRAAHLARHWLPVQSPRAQRHDRRHVLFVGSAEYNTDLLLRFVMPSVL